MQELFLRFTVAFPVQKKGFRTSRQVLSALHRFLEKKSGMKLEVVRMEDTFTFQPEGTLEEWEESASYGRR